MDAFNTIAVAMAAIFFTWVGYFLGIFFPTFGKSKSNQMERKAAGEKLIDFNSLWEKINKSKNEVTKPKEKSEPSGLGKAWKKAVDWLLEREEDPEEESGEQSEQEELPPQPVQAESPQQETDQPVTDVNQPVYVPVGLDIPEDAILLWHDRQNKKLFARVGKDVVDLDQDLTKSQHGSLSMLLVDLQERVGLSATLRAAISEGTEQAYAEKEKQNKIASLPTDEPVQPPSFNPVKTFINYVKADVPKLEEKPESIPAQINRILQELIVDTPLKERGISVGEWPNRGVVFLVGIDVYSSIDEIPDEQIQKVIRFAVKQWEETQSEE